MLYESLLLSAIVLVIVNLGYRSQKAATRIACGCCAFVLVGPLFWRSPLGVPFFLRQRSVLLLQCVVLVALTWSCRKSQWRAWSFAVISLSATVLTYGVGFAEAWMTHASYTNLRERFPFESMEGRVPAPARSAAASNLPATTLAHLQEQEKELNRYVPASEHRMLRQIHNQHWDTFINSPAFGELRRFRPTDEHVARFVAPRNYSEPPAPQPGPAPAPLSTSAELGRELVAPELLSLWALQQLSYFQFINREGFGLVVDRQKVAGFQPHGFRSLPEAKDWKVARVDLVGMLLHNEPVVYLTDGLPRMDKAREAPTRALDLFESLGLAELHKGQDLFVRETAKGTRMLGALRAVDQCTRCHDCQRGDLLGAFTYCLGPQPQTP